MKKLSLLVALGLFTLGTATMVKAQEDSDVTIPVEPVEQETLEEPVSAGEDQTTEMSQELIDRFDTDGDGFLNEEEAKAAAAAEQAK